MDHLVYPRERTLSTITLVLGTIAWLVIVVGTVGGALLALLAGFIAYCFAQSALIGWIKGNGVRLDERQFPDLHAQFVACCDKLGIAQRPQAYVVNGNGTLNAFATRFLGHDYVVLLSDTIDAMREHPDGLAFYIGHELGHLRMKHMSKHLVRWPVLWLPLLGAAYGRAKESTCDRHGAACCSSPDNAALALGALAAGGQRWRQLDLPALHDQARESRGFWMSFHELCAGYPWLTKRVVRVSKGDAAVPARHPLAGVLAVFVPYAGRLGGGFGLLILVYIVGVLAAVALPAYKSYVLKARFAAALVETEDARKQLATFYNAQHRAPATLDEAGVPARLADGTTMTLDPQSMLVTVSTPNGDLVFEPRGSNDGAIDGWQCRPGENVRASDVPRSCRLAAP